MILVPTFLVVILGTYIRMRVPLLGCPGLGFH